MSERTLTRSTLLRSLSLRFCFVAFDPTVWIFVEEAEDEDEEEAVEVDIAILEVIGLSIEKRVGSE